MKCAARASALILVGFLAMTSPCLHAAGPGGGHGASGGHGSSGHGSGGHAGRSSTGSSSGHSSSHSIGHSLAHFFGHHGQRATPAPLTGAPSERAKATPSSESIARVLERQPKNRLVSRPIGFFPRRGAFGFGGCPYRGFDYNFRFASNWNCFNDGFFFDPFFSGWFSGRLSGGPALGEPNPAYPPTNSDSANEVPNSSRSATPSQNGVKAERPSTLLQLRDGSMYGLTDYWAKDDVLHYTTTYGGQNSLPFDRIDFEKTVQLNADRGVPFCVQQ